MNEPAVFYYSPQGGLERHGMTSGCITLLSNLNSVAAAVIY